jgi:hypothetical protein
MAQGNVGALTMQRQFDNHYAKALRAVGVDSTRVKKAVATVDKTGMLDKRVTTDVPQNSAGILGEANLALLGASSVRPAVMAKAMFQKRDYLRFAAQLLFGDTSTEPKQEDISANLFVPEASKYALNLLGGWRPRSQGRTAKQFALNFGFYYALKELPSDSTDTLEDMGVIHAHLGVEYVIFQKQLSVYLDGHLLSNQENIADYEAFFGKGTERTFVYAAPGVRVKFSDKLFVDLEMLILNNDMKTLRGTDDGILPIIRLGFSQTVTDFGVN